MRGYNHIAGGLAFTGIFASFADVNIFSQPQYVVGCVFFSLLPDVDHTRSTLGKVFWPVAKWLDRHHGHRTVTHCLPFFLAVVLGVGLAEQLITGGRVFTGIASLALASHLLFDMCTRQGIPLFLPFTRARCVLPGNPNMRLSSKSPLAEIAVFFGFCLLILSTLPLMANGFWVSINNTFASFGHVLREYERRPDVLLLTTKEGVSGEVVAATTSSAVVWTGHHFVTLTEGQHHPKNFSHTGRTRAVQRVEFVAIGSDSLRHILAQPVLSIAATSSAPIRYRVAGQQYEQSSLKFDYPPAVQFSEIKADSSSTGAQLVRLRATVAAAAHDLAKFQAEQRATAARVQHLHTSYSRLSEYEQGQATEELAKLRAELAAARAPDHSAETGVALTEIARLKKVLAGQKHTFTGVATIWKR